MHRDCRIAHLDLAAKQHDDTAIALARIAQRREDAARAAAGYPTNRALGIMLVLCAFIGAACIALPYIH